MCVWRAERLGKAEVDEKAAKKKKHTEIVVDSTAHSIWLYCCDANSGCLAFEHRNKIKLLNSLKK